MQLRVVETVRTKNGNVSARHYYIIYRAVCREQDKDGGNTTRIHPTLCVGDPRVEPRTEMNNRLRRSDKGRAVYCIVVRFAEYYCVLPIKPVRVCRAKEGRG